MEKNKVGLDVKKKQDTVNQKKETAMEGYTGLTVNLPAVLTLGSTLMFY